MKGNISLKKYFNHTGIEANLAIMRRKKKLCSLDIFRPSQIHGQAEANSLSWLACP